MLNPNVSKPTTPGVSRLGSEFSSSQLVIATCVFLIMALVCFALGVMVGRYDKTSSRPKQSVQSTDTVGEASKTLPPPPRKDAAAPAEEGVQKSPRPVVMPPSKTSAPGFPAASGAAAAAPTVREHPAPPKQAATPVPPVTAAVQPAPSTPAPKPVEQTPAAPAAAATAPSSATVAQAPVPPTPPTPTAPAPAAVPTEAKAPVSTAAAPLPVPGSEKAPAPVAGAPVTPAATEAPAKEGGSTGDYGVQVASFSGPNRLKVAETSRRRLESNSGMKADLVTSEDGKMIRLIVGHYPDKESAVKACNELKQRAGFSDSFARKR